jgi:hypothetical protein
MQAETISHVRCTPTIEVSNDPPKARKSQSITLTFVSGNQERMKKDSLFMKNSIHMTPAEALHVGNMLINAAATRA